MVITGGTQGGVGVYVTKPQFVGVGSVGAPDGLGSKGLAHQDMSDFFTLFFPYESTT